MGHLLSGKMGQKQIYDSKYGMGTIDRASRSETKKKTSPKGGLVQGGILKNLFPSGVL